MKSQVRDFVVVVDSRGCIPNGCGRRYVLMSWMLWCNALEKRDLNLGYEFGFW
jgi:hypothetical protein